MPAEDLHQPHDRFFKQIFGHPATAAAFFESYLPQWLVQAAEWNGLERLAASFVDAALRQQESDLLFRVPFKGLPLYIYCLFEHQRRVDNWMVLRLLDYMVQIWKQVLKEDPRATTLPAIVPLVLYQGAAGWTAPMRLREVLNIPKEAASLLANQPDFEYTLVDLSKIPAEQVQGDLVGRLALSLMKAVAEDRLTEWLERAGPMLVELLRQEHVVGIFETLLRYLFAADSSVSFETVRTMVERSEAAETKERVMSIAEELIQKGRKEAMSIAEELIQKGRKEGRQEGRQEGALIGRIQMLQELSGLTVSQFSELATKPIEELERLVQQLRSGLSNRPKQ